jgi:hypothetical protein
MVLSDDTLVKIVLNSDDFKGASSIPAVRSAVRRVLRKELIDMHINDSSEVMVRECMVNRHIEWITLRILKEVDGILLIPEYYDDLENFARARARESSAE